MIPSPQQILVALLGSSPQLDLGDPAILVDNPLCDGILSEASRLGVLPMLYTRLDSAGLLSQFPRYFVDRCKESWRHTTFTNLRLVHVFGQVVSRLQAAQIPVVALKGIYLAVHVYPHSGMRQMGDIDLLVPKEYLSRASEILCDLGYVQLADAAYAAYDDMQAAVEIAHHLAPFVKKGSPTIELHWHIVKPGELLSVFSMEELWRRTVGCTIGNVSTLALTNEANFVHLCMHISYHHLFAFGLRPLVDIHTLLSTCGDRLDWDEIAACGASWQVMNGIHLTLAVIHRLFGTQIPAQFQDAVCIPEEVLRLVIAQIFADATDSHNLTLLAKLYSRGNPLERFRAALRRIFIQPYPIFSRKYLPFVFARTARLFALYWGDLLRLYGPQRDQSLAVQAERYAEIYRWLR